MDEFFLPSTYFIKRRGKEVIFYLYDISKEGI